jgi:hypothetical protein
MRTVTGFAAAAIFGGCGLSSLVIAQNAPQNYCRTIPTRTDASDWPSKHAWNLFVSLNHPAIDKSVARGVPDCTKPFGSPDTTAVWETWRNANSEVYLKDGSEPPLWDDTRLPDEAPGRVPQLPKLGSEAGIAFSPTDGIFHNAGGFGETRLNRATYEFVRNQCLFSVEGQQRYSKAVEAGAKPPIQFPPDSIEVKAAWLDFADPQGDGSVPSTPPEKQRTYYTAEFEGKKFGLTALHILTKDLTNWFWASFHHKDAPSDNVRMSSPDTYGPAPEVQGTVWENYQLGGTQTDFTLPTGQTTLLSDHYVEFGFVRSSCMTCHALAAISSEIATSQSGRKFTSIPNAQETAVCNITPEENGVDRCRKLIGDGAFQTGTDKLILERGVPNEKWFQKNGKPFYIQTDFVFSVPFRGRSEAASPKRCIW